MQNLVEKMCKNCLEEFYIQKGNANEKQELPQTAVIDMVVKEVKPKANTKKD